MALTQKYRPPGDPYQQRAICHFHGSCEVIAGPGSGKTFVLTEHILYLLLVRKVPPSSILVLTFSKAAAKEMKSRFFQKYAALRPSAEVDAPVVSAESAGLSESSGSTEFDGSVAHLCSSEFDDSVVPLCSSEAVGSFTSAGSSGPCNSSQPDSVDVAFGTVHSVFLHILNQSIPVPYKVLDPASRGKLLRILLRRYDSGNSPDTDAENPDKLAECDNAIARYKSSAALDTSDLPDHFHDIFRKYNRYLSENHLLDFDDILTECLHLFRSSPDILREWRQRFRFILFDEFQDISPVQYELVMLLKGKNGSLFAAGDDDQCIYSFRGSDPSFFGRLEEDCARAEEPFEKIVLSANYRSEYQIIQASTRLIRQNKNRIAKKPKPQKRGGLFQIEGYESVTVQYRSILAEIMRLPTSRRTQTAVIFRTRRQLNQFQKELYTFLEMEMGSTDSSLHVGDTELMMSPFIYPKIRSMVEDLLAYYRIASDSASGIIRRRDLLRILNKPQRYLSRELFTQEIVQIRTQMRNVQRQSPSLARELEYFFGDIRFLSGLPPSLSLAYLLQTIGYEAFLTENYAGWIAGILQTYLSVLRQRAQVITSASDFTRFLQDLSENPENLIQISRRHPNEIPLKKQLRFQNRKTSASENSPLHKMNSTSDGSAVRLTSSENRDNLPRLMTMHACKGLEFDTVYLPDLNEGILPGRRCRTETQLEEERRLLYVAMTRAIHSLHLSYVAGNRHNPRRPSRFLQVFGIKPYEMC